MLSRKKSKKIHSQSKYLTLMIVPDSTSANIRSIKVPHWFMRMLGGTACSALAAIMVLAMVSSYSRHKLNETAKIIEVERVEKQELMDQKALIENQKKNIENSLNNQQGDYEKQLEFYAEQVLQIESRLAEIENQARESYEKMNYAGTPVSKKFEETYMGGGFSPEFDENTTATEKLNTILAMTTVACDSTEQFMAEYVEDAEKFADFRESFPNIWPVTGRVTSEQGGRIDPINGSKASHEGIDIKVSTGTRVKATGKGVVKSAGYVSGYGYLVVINHGYGYETYYAHNSKLLVSRGDSVERGDIIALSGNTGRSTGPHVHYEVRYNGVIKNPRNYFGALDN